MIFNRIKIAVDNLKNLSLMNSTIAEPKKIKKSKIYFDKKNTNLITKEKLINRMKLVVETNMFHTFLKLQLKAIDLQKIT